MDVEKKHEDRETDREAAGGRNYDRQLVEKQERVGRWTDRQMDGRGDRRAAGGRNDEGQLVDVEKNRSG